jgi:hypothetical protein
MKNCLLHLDDVIIRWRYTAIEKQCATTNKFDCKLIGFR